MEIKLYKKVLWFLLGSEKKCFKFQYLCDHNKECVWSYSFLGVMVSIYPSMLERAHTLQILVLTKLILRLLLLCISDQLSCIKLIVSFSLDSSSNSLEQSSKDYISCKRIIHCGTTANKFFMFTKEVHLLLPTRISHHNSPKLPSTLLPAHFYTYKLTMV